MRRILTLIGCMITSFNSHNSPVWPELFYPYFTYEAWKFYRSQLVQRPKKWSGWARTWSQEFKATLSTMALQPPLLQTLNMGVSREKMMLRACLSLRKPCRGKSEAIKQMYFLVVETHCCLNPALHWEHLKCLFSWNLLLDLGAWQRQRNSTRVLGNF